MQDEANIVKHYKEANVSGRIEILIKYYPNFIRLVEGYEQSLSFIIFVLYLKQKFWHVYQDAFMRGIKRK